MLEDDHPGIRTNLCMVEPQELNIFSNKLVDTEEGFNLDLSERQIREARRRFYRLRDRGMSKGKRRLLAKLRKAAQKG